MKWKKRRRERERDCPKLKSKRVSSRVYGVERKSVLADDTTIKGVKRNNHHLTPRSRKGDNEPSNLLNIYIDRHFYFHKVFGNRTLGEVIELLQRLQHMKERQGPP